MTPTQLIALLSSVGALVTLAMAILRALDDPSVPNLAAAIITVMRYT